MPKRTPSEIYKKAKKAGYPYSYESFRDTDYPNVPEDFHELFGDEIKMFKPKKKKEGGLIGGQKKLDANKDGKISGEDFKILQGSKKGMRMGGMMQGYGAARKSGMGLQDETMKPGKVMKARVGGLSRQRLESISNYRNKQAKMKKEKQKEENIRKTEISPLSARKGKMIKAKVKK